MKIYVHLWHSLDVDNYRRRFEEGRSSDRTPYGYHHAAEEEGVELKFSKSQPEGQLGRLFRRGLAAILGCDMVHLFRNRHAAQEASVIWSHTEREALALTMFFRLTKRSARPKLLLQSVWLLDQWDQLPYFRRAIYRSCLSYADVLTFHSPMNRDAAEFIMVAGREFVPFGISTEVFPLASPEEAKYRFLEKSITQGAPVKILAIGNDVHRDWTCLIEAFEGHHQFNVRVASSTFPSKQLSVGSNFEVKPAVTLDSIRELYRGSNLVVLPLRYNLHASGLTVLLEAVALGCPVVASRTGGLDYYFDDDEVIFVDPGDSQALRRAVEQLVLNPERRHHMASKALERFKKEDYSSRGYAIRQVELSRKLLN